MFMKNNNKNNLKSDKILNIKKKYINKTHDLIIRGL